MLSELALGPPKLLLEGQLHGSKLVLVGKDEFIQLTVNYRLVVDDGKGAGFEGVEVGLQVEEQGVVLLLLNLEELVMLRFQV